MYKLLLVAGAALALTACGDHDGGGSGSASTYNVGGSISGLSTAGLVLRNNAGNNLTLAANATSFQFPVAGGGNYSIAVAAQPTGLICAVSNGIGGNVSADISNVLVACSPTLLTVSGTISGLTGNGLVLQMNGGGNLSIAANTTTFVFTSPVTYGDSYAVTALAQPNSLACSIANASGTPTTPVNNVAVTCAAVQFSRFDGHNVMLTNERLARDAASGDPFYFVFVDNTSVASPDGGYQHPYATLAEAAANSAPQQIIYVFPGDGTTTGMDAGIVLQADQKLWGAGLGHVIETSEGSVTIPAAAGSAPKIANAVGDAVTLSTNNAVSGLALAGGTGSGIFGADVGSVEISGNVFSNGASISSAPLILTAASGPFSAAIEGNTFSDNTTGAMHFVLSDVESTLSIAGNTITGNGIGGA